MSSETQERIMTIDEVAEALGISKHTIRLNYLKEGKFPNAKKVSIKDAKGIKRKRWDIPESDVMNFQKPKVGPPPGRTKDEKAGHRHITLEPDVDKWLDKKQESEPGFKVSEFINGLIREAMGREDKIKVGPIAYQQKPIEEWVEAEEPGIYRTNIIDPDKLAAWNELEFQALPDEYTVHGKFVDYTVHGKFVRWDVATQRWVELPPDEPPQAEV